MPKSRNQTPVPMKVYRRFDIMQMTDNPNFLGRRWIEKVPHYDYLEKLSNAELIKVAVQMPDGKARRVAAKRRAKVLQAAKENRNRTSVEKSKTFYNKWLDGRGINYKRRRRTISRSEDTAPIKNEAVRAEPARSGFSSKSIQLRGRTMAESRR